MFTTLLAIVPFRVVSFALFTRFLTFSGFETVPRSPTVSAQLDPHRILVPRQATALTSHAAAPPRPTT